MPTPNVISQLVARFDQQRQVYRAGKYNETQLRREFLDPFFEALGWDMTNRDGLAEIYKEVIHEDSLEIEGENKAPDYAFRIGGTRKFFVEAKKPAVNIEFNIHPAFQLRRYAWSAKLPLGILTDFEEFAIYDCRVKPDKGDKASTARILLFSYKDYLNKWDEIVSVFSREAVLKGSFDSYAETLKSKKGTTEVDDAFLAEIERWRELLARNIALRNPNLTARELNYAVQMTIDRIVFLRICEDRGIERDEQLKDISTQKNIYENLVLLFQRADARYNSGLFHFKNDKEQSSGPDSLTLHLKIDDRVLHDILSNLYYPESPYVFREIPSDILGQVYERFLGKVIRLTDGHQAKIEEKPEVRKAGGVYYTPTYIVDYIVQNTVGKLLEEKTPKEVAKLKFLDPACGSGTFPLGAYQYLLDWHLKWYIENDLEKSLSGRKPVLYQSKDGYQLTTAKKKEILLNNIFGVDIDAQAVEVTKLSLLLKVLEGENQETIGSQLSFLQERVLPDLGKNIQCGNSLIGPDYHEGQQLTMSFADQEERYRVNAFDWKGAFPQVFVQGGFDAVFGNPPYGALFNDADKSYIRSHFKTYKYRFDSYVYFIEKAITLTKPKGYISFITPELWLKLENNDALREYIAENADLEKLWICGENVFADATVNTVVFRLHRGIKAETVEIERGSASWELSSDLWKKAKGFEINYRINPEHASIIGKIKAFPTLSNFGEAIQGITPYDKYRGQNPELIKRRGYHFDYKKDETCGKWLSGKDVSRYNLSWSGEWLSYGPWLGAPRESRFFEGTRLLFREVPGVGKRIQATIAFDEVLYHGHSITPFKLSEKSDVKIQYLLALVNSSLISWYGGKTLPNFGKDVFPKLNPQDILAIPIRPINFSNPSDKSRHDKLVSLVDRLLELHKGNPRTPQEQELVSREIKSKDKQIDTLVHELYALTADEISIVELNN
jgi:type I restriction-modification system DNA methylase subunit